MRERVPGGQVALQGRAARHGGCEYRAVILHVLHGGSRSHRDDLHVRICVQVTLMPARIYVHAH